MTSHHDNHHPGGNKEKRLEEDIEIKEQEPKDIDKNNDSNDIVYHHISSVVSHGSKARTTNLWVDITDDILNNHLILPRM